MHLVQAQSLPGFLMKAKVALIIYKIGVKLLNRFFEYTNNVSYEWYLVHILVFSIYFKFARGIMPFYVDWCLLMGLSYVVAIGYHWVVKRIKW